MINCSHVGIKADTRILTTRPKIKPAIRPPGPGIALAIASGPSINPVTIKENIA